MASDYDDDGVGYRRPPHAHRFRKGQSGNPRGRPRKKSALALIEDLAETPAETIFRRILDKKFKITDGSGTKTVSGLEVILQAQFQRGAKGDVRAQRDILDSAARLENRNAARRSAEEARRREDFESTLRWKAQRERDWKLAQAQGTEPDDPWPHPYDILVNHQTQTYRVRGPLYVSDEPYFEYLLAQRDLNLCWASLDLRRRSRGPESLQSFFELLALFYDSLLPARWQLGQSRDRILLGIEMLATRELKAIIKALEGDRLYWHKRAFPLGEKVRLDPSTRKVLKPVIARLGFRSFAQYERHLEQESGNPPLMIKQSA